MPTPSRRRIAPAGPGVSPRGADLDPTTATLATCGAMLCEVRYWTEAEWAALPERDRPRERAHAPGRGWLAAVPLAGIN